MPKSENITILVADDHKWFRDGLIDDLEDISGLLPIGEAESGEKALDLAIKLKPNLILMDIDMPGMSGIEATRRLIQKISDPPLVLMLTGFDTDDNYLVEAYESGASGYLIKTITCDELIRKVTNVVNHGTQEWPDRVRKLLAERTYKTEKRKLAQELTDPEIENLRLFDRGYEVKKIAKERNVSRNTVKSQLSTAMTKLQASNSKEAAWLARKAALFND